MTIRIATLSDLDAIMAIENASFPSDAWSRESMAAELASDYSHYLVDEDAGEIIGYAGLRSIRGNADADVQTIALIEARRGEGRGRAMLRALLAEASARRAREVFLEVRADNPGAETLYLSEGFQEIARRPRYYQPDNVDAIVMKCDLARRATASAADAASAVASVGEENTRSGGGVRENDPPVPAISSRTDATSGADAASADATAALTSAEEETA